MNSCNLSPFSQLQGNTWDMLMGFIFTKILTKTVQRFKMESCWCSHSMIFFHRLFFGVQGKTRHSHVGICQRLSPSACYELFVRVIYAATGSKHCHDRIQIPNKKNICQTLFDSGWQIIWYSVIFSRRKSLLRLPSDKSTLLSSVLQPSASSRGAEPCMRGL